MKDGGHICRLPLCESSRSSVLLFFMKDGNEVSLPVIFAFCPIDFFFLFSVLKTK